MRTRKAPAGRTWILAVAMLAAGLVACAGTAGGEAGDAQDAIEVAADPGIDPVLPGETAADPGPSDDGIAPIADEGPPRDVAPLAACPDAQSPGTYDRTACTGGFHCEYGHECCCGRCSASVLCDCSGGWFSCYWSDFCLGMDCSPECDAAGLWTTAQGCRTCEEIATGVAEGVAAALANALPCTADTDCTTVASPRECLGRCPEAFHVERADGLAAALAKVGDDWCRFAHGCPVATPECPAGRALCMDGTCAVVGPCDGVRETIGEPCDDHDACTEGDTCVSAGTCRGRAGSCDDGNPCTVDSCNAASGCLHALNEGAACPASKACVPGATCMQGACVDAPSEGWIRTLADPGAGAPFSAAPDGNGGFVLLVNRWVAVRAVPHLLRLDGAGALQSDTPIALDASAEGRRLVVRPGGSVAFLAVGWPDARVVLVDAAGAVTTRTLHPGAIGVDPLDLSAGPGGDLGVVGTLQKPANSWRSWFLRLDAAGGVVQDVDLGPAAASDVGRVRAAGDGFAMVVGAPDTAPQGDLVDPRFVRIDGTGAIVADRVLHADGSDFVAGFEALADGAFVAAGSRIVYGEEAKSDVGWVRRIEADGSPGWAVERTGESFSAMSWNGSVLVLLGRGFVRLDAAGTIVGERPVGTSLFRGALVMLPDPLGATLAGTTEGSSTGAYPWLARFFDPCEGGDCPRPGCP